MTTKKASKRKSVALEPVTKKLQMYRYDLDNLYDYFAVKDKFTLFVAPFADHEELGRVLNVENESLALDALFYSEVFETRDAALDFVTKLKEGMEEQGTNLNEVEVMLYLPDQTIEELESACPL